MPRFIVLGISILALLAFPLFTRDPYILHLMILWFLWSIVASSWAVILGFLGIFHFAQYAFFGLGGYASALITMNLGFPPWLGILFAGLCVGVISLGLSLPALRLRGPYIAVVSLGFAECIRITTSNLAFTGAELGIWGVQTLFMKGGKIGFYYCTLLVCMAVVGFLYLLLTSKYGLAVKAMKQSLDSSGSVGIQIYKTKISFFFISASSAGIAGGLYVHYMTGISPEIYNIANMIDVMVMGLVGGLSSVFGPVIGAGVVFFSLENLRVIQDLRFMVYAGVMILIMIFKPEGVYSFIDQFFNRFNETPVKALQK
jgi:branched-chain amino acid transport system permease protein